MGKSWLLRAGIPLVLLFTTAFFPTHAEGKGLPYPDAPPDAVNLARQVYFVNHFHAFQNYAILDRKKAITVVINRAKNGSMTTNTVERYINNDYHDGVIQSKDLAIFRSGRLRGTGMLITDYLEPGKSQSYAIWLPKLRRIRRFAEPAHDDAWSGSVFTFGDVYLRKPEHETHELLSTERFGECLRVMDIPANQRARHMENLPEASCHPRERAVYHLKSTTRFPDWWYDYRVSYIDTESFADYRTEYFKDGRRVKFIDRDWRAPKSYRGSDPRAMSWGYWYGQDLESGLESWAVIPPEVVKIDDDSLKSRLWTEQTLRKIRR